MSKERGFTDDLKAINANVEHEVGRYVKLLRRESTPETTSPSTTTPRRTDTDREMKVAETADSEPVGTPAAESRARTAPRLRQKTVIEEKVIRENVSLRIRPETNELLTEVALRQKLKKELPDTRQDIADEALRDWYRKHGYAR